MWLEIVLHSSTETSGLSVFRTITERIAMPQSRLPRLPKTAMACSASNAPEFVDPAFMVGNLIEIRLIETRIHEN